MFCIYVYGNQIRFAEVLLPSALFIDKLGETIAVIFFNMVLSIGQFLRLSVTLCLWFHVTV